MINNRSVFQKTTVTPSFEMPMKPMAQPMAQINAQLMAQQMTQPTTPKPKKIEFYQAKRPIETQGSDFKIQNQG